MNNIILSGKILFDPENKTNKHNYQAAWKRMAMIMFDGDIAEYYAWFIKKRYNLILNKPLRGAHISFINDSNRDIQKGCGLVNEKDVDLIWELIKQKWNGKSIDVTLNTDVRSDGKHWWLNIPEENRQLIHDIRKEIGLDKPFFGLHMSVGYANEINIVHSKYILGLIEKFGEDYT
jgi:hypothetical protein